MKVIPIHTSAGSSPRSSRAGALVAFALGLLALDGVAAAKEIAGPFAPMQNCPRPAVDRPATSSIANDCPGAVISNGTVQMGVHCEGHLNVPVADDELGIGEIGLRYIPTGAASTEPGCLCEGWGVADVTSGAAGYANESSDGGAINLTVLNFTADATTAISTVQVGTTFRVTHTYRPNPLTPNVYDVLVTITNISAAPTHVLYRRVMDWDIYPTPFEEYVTIVNGNSGSLIRTDTNGFNSANPFEFSSYAPGPVTDAGPDDHGALFDFDFGTLAPSASITFRTLYGASGTEAGALAALNAVGAEAYSLGQPSTVNGASLGEPNTFMFGFAGIGGNPVGCGNGTVEPGEQCDDGDNESGDGCDANCSTTACGNGIATDGEQCDDGNRVDGDCCSNACETAAAGTACELDGTVCTADQCNAGGVCVAAAEPVNCDDGNPCNGLESCNPLSGCVAGTPPEPPPSVCGPVCGNGMVEAGEDCDGNTSCCDPETCLFAAVGSECDADTNVCTDDVCGESGVCLHPANSASCEDGSLCTLGDSCSDGTCISGTPLSCDDSDACTSDTCNPSDGSCNNIVAVESAACASCDDGIDNDDDGLIDGEDEQAGVCTCSSLCKQFRFAATVTLANPKRFGTYTGADVVFASSPLASGDSGAGLCGSSVAMRAGGSFGTLAVTGNTDFGKGASLVSSTNESGESATQRSIDIRQEFASNGGGERIRNIAPLVGPGTCSTDPMQMCVLNADCGSGTCDGRGRLDTAGNPYVSRNGSADLYDRCVDAIAAVPGEATMLANLAGTVPGYSTGSTNIRTSGSTATLSINVGPGQQVMHVGQVVVAGKTRVELIGTPSTTLLIRVNRNFRLGGDAEIVLSGGLTADRVLWLIEGTSGGRPRLARASRCSGTLIAPQRRGILFGGSVVLDGAVKSQRLHLGQGARINHMPFSGLLQ